MLCIFEFIDLCLIANIDSLILNFSILKNNLNLTSYFSKLIGIVDFNRHLIECELCFRVVIKQNSLKWM